jgi:alkylation response protein AidB-like acyl-CoA dehydrogenase
MDFTIDTEQQDLVGAVRSLVTKVYGSSETRRAATNTEPGFAAWGQLAEMGLLGLPFEATAAEVSLVAEELGKVIAPDPFIEASVFAGGLVQAVGGDANASLLEAIAEGTTFAAVAWLEPGRGWAADASGVTFADGRLAGVKAPVLHADHADVLIVSAANGSGTGLYLVSEGYTCETQRAHDGSRTATVTFDGTPAVPLGAGGDDTAALEHAVNLARIAYGHEALGAMQVALDLTVGYLKTRKQFGVTLNSFQALTFRAADLYVALELARSAITWATIVAADEASTAADVAAAASHSAIQVARAGTLIALDSIQLHGGIGMTAEYSVGHYASRILAIGQLIGDEAFHVERLAATIGDHDVLDPIG